MLFLVLVAGGVLMSPPVLSVGKAAAAPAGGFKDVPETHWARETIEKAVQLGIVEGYPGGRFGPDDIVQADQLLAMIYRAHIREYTDSNGNVRRDWDKEWFDRATEYQPGFTWKLVNAVITTGFEFQAAKTGYWAQPFIDLAYESGYLFGYSTAFPQDYDFRKPITREQASYLLGAWYRMYENGFLPSYEEYALEQVGIKDLSDFSMTEVSNYRATVILAGLMQGWNDRFYPQRYVTRAEAVTMVLRLRDPSLRTPFKPDLSGVCYTASMFGEIKIFDDLEKCRIAKEILDLARKTPVTGFVEYGNNGISIFKDRQVFEQTIRDIKTGNFDSPNKAGLGLGVSPHLDPQITLKFTNEAIETYAKEFFLAALDYLSGGNGEDMLREFQKAEARWDGDVTFTVNGREFTFRKVEDDRVIFFEYH